jgi:hypothetical protein
VESNSRFISNNKVQAKKHSLLLKALERVNMMEEESIIPESSEDDELDQCIAKYIKLL